jgi:lipopolysaccharide export system permease protein
VRLLDRYLFRELLTPLAYCLGGFLIFYLSFSLFTGLPDLQEHKLHLLDVLAFSAAQTPDFLVLVLPVALLLALLYTLTQHARHNEITAMRAAGLSLWRICLPYFGVGLLASGVLFWLNEGVVPRSAEWAQRIRTRYVQTPEDLRQQTSAQQFGMINERTHRHWFCNEYDPRTSEMRGDLYVVWDLPDRSRRTLHAARAERTNGVWTFFGNVTVMAQADPDQLVFARLLETNVLAMPEFDETPRQIQSEIKLGNKETFNPRTENISLREIWDYLREHPQMSKQHSSDLLTRFHRRLAAPWTCLVVVLIAIPFGAGSGRRNLFFGVAGSIFIVAGYLVTQQVSLAVGTYGYLPAGLAAWLPNLLFGALGVFLTARVR